VGEVTLTSDAAVRQEADIIRHSKVVITPHKEVNTTTLPMEPHRLRMVQRLITIVLSHQWVGINMVSQQCTFREIVFWTNSKAGSNVELQPLAPNGSGYGQQKTGDTVLNECRKVDGGIDFANGLLGKLKTAQSRSLTDANSSAAMADLDALNSQIMNEYRVLAASVKRIKQKPDSGSPMNTPQVGRVDRKLKNAVNDYQRMEAVYRQQLQEQMKRQYRIVLPDASDAEVAAAVEDTSNQQVFSQALMQSTRRGDARQALSAVEDRHGAIQKIERQMVELAELFNQMNELVEQQEAAVVVIEQKGEEVVDNMENGNVQLTTGIKSARAARRKKWWCLLIAVIIVIIIVVIVIIVVKVVLPQPKAKRSLVEVLQARYLPAADPRTLRGRMGLLRAPDWTPDSQ
jgi:syntaxin 1B/2/3